jgi:nitrous oxidase accessory protein
MPTESRSLVGGPARPRWVALFLAGLAVGAMATEPAGAQRSWVVGEGGDHATLTAALNASEDGDTLRLLPGRYAEGPLTIDRSIALVGAGGGDVVIDGEGSGTVVRIVADGVTLRGLVIRGAVMSHVRDHAAIRVEEAGGCTIEGNRLEENFFGIYLARVKGCRIADNEIRGAGERASGAGNGVHLWNADDVVVEGNRVVGHRDGIYLEFARRTVVNDNRAEGNLRYGLHLMFSGESRFTRNHFANNGAGVAVMFSEGVTIAANSFEDNRGPAAYGLLIKDLRDSEVRDNRFVANTVALHSEGADRMLIRGNLFLRNGRAVRLLASSQENRFEGNDFVANTFDVTTNSRHHFNHFEGNYWSAYRGYDLTGDGYGDVPHRPVRLFGLIAERQPVAMVLLRSLFVDLLDLAERVIPALTPEALMDERPSMRSVAT